MTMRVKRWIVDGLETLCGWLDNVPGWHWDGETRRFEFYRYSCYGCYPLRLASLSDKLDQRWGTGCWKVVDSSKTDWTDADDAFTYEASDEETED